MTIQDTREDEQARTITIKATAVSLFFSLEEELIRDVVLTQLRGSDAERAVFTCSFVFGVNCAWIQSLICNTGYGWWRQAQA